MKTYDSLLYLLTCVCLSLMTEMWDVTVNFTHVFSINIFTTCPNMLIDNIFSLYWEKKQPCRVSSPIVQIKAPTCASLFEKFWVKDEEKEVKYYSRWWFLTCKKYSSSSSEHKYRAFNWHDSSSSMYADICWWGECELMWLYAPVMLWFIYFINYILIIRCITIVHKKLERSMDEMWLWWWIQIMFNNIYFY